MGLAVLLGCYHSAASCICEEAVETILIGSINQLRDLFDQIVAVDQVIPVCLSDCLKQGGFLSRIQGKRILV